MAAKKKFTLSACDEAPTRRVLHMDDPRRAPLDWHWAGLLHDGTLFGGRMDGGKAKLFKLAPNQERQDFEIPPNLCSLETRVLSDGSRAIGIEEKTALLEVDFADGSVRSVYTIVRDGLLSDGLTSVDYVSADLVVAMLGKTILVLVRGADGRFVERSSVSHSGFGVSAVEGRYVVSRAEKTLRFFGLVADGLVELGSIALKFGQLAEVMRDGVPTVVVSTDTKSWSFVEGLSEAFAVAAAPAGKKKPAKSTQGPAKLALERSDTGPAPRARLDAGMQLVGTTKAGRTIAIDGSRIVAIVRGESTELAGYEPGVQIYAASVHPAEERVLVGAAPVFPAALVEIDIDTKQQTDLAAAVQRASYLGKDHVVSLEYGTKRLTLRRRGTPLGAAVFELSTEAQSLIADPESGWLVLTGIGALGKKRKTELHRLVIDDEGVRLMHVADLAPKSQRLEILFVHELLVDGDTLHIRSGSDWYSATPG